MQEHQQPLPFPHVQGIFHPSQTLNKIFPSSVLRPGHCIELFPMSRSRQLVLPWGNSTSHSWAGSGAADCLLWLSPFFLCPETMSSIRRRRTAVCRETPHPRAHSELITKDKTQPAQLPHHTTIKPGLKWFFQHWRRERCLRGLWEQQGAAFPPPWKQGHPFFLVD